MNKDNARDYLPLAQALAEGKSIQWKHRTMGWIDSNELSDAYPASDYRIKPEPREIWVNRYPNGVVSGPCDSEQEAHRLRANDTAVQVRYREVIE